MKAPDAIMAATARTMTLPRARTERGPSGAIRMMHTCLFAAVPEPSNPPRMVARAIVERQPLHARDVERAWTPPEGHHGSRHVQRQKRPLGVSASPWVRFAHHRCRVGCQAGRPAAPPGQGQILPLNRDCARSLR